MPFGEQQITRALSELPVTLSVVHGFEELLALLPEADMLVSADCAAEFAAPLAAALRRSRVRYYQVLSAGRERLVGAGIPASIELFGPGEAIAPAVAEHAFALALALYRGIPGAVSAGAWTREGVASLRCMEGDTALVVGLGAIGRDVARRAKAFGMQVLAVNRTQLACADCDEVYPLAQLDDLLPRAGLVVLTLALTPQTRGILGARQFAAMRRGAFVVNVARGGLIDQAALGAALSSGWLGGVGLDVADPEPLPDSDPLWRAPNLVVTPHVAAVGSVLSQERLAATVALNVSRLLAR